MESDVLIEGVTLTQLAQIRDERGAVLHMQRCDESDFTRFGECYFSEVLPGAIKAWKRHREQVQNLAVPVGIIRLVIYDDREASLTRGRLQEFELGRPNMYVRLRIPQNLWYGFSCIGLTPALLANCTNLPHDSNESELLSLETTMIPYQWRAINI